MARRAKGLLWKTRPHMIAYYIPALSEREPFLKSAFQGGSSNQDPLRFPKTYRACLVGRLAVRPITPTTWTRLKGLMVSGLAFAQSS